jgi:putative endonuclease
LESSSGKLNLPDGIGRAGEAAAASFIRRETGMDLIETNFRTREGEIDIVARENDGFVFIEVKTRTNRKFGGASEQISTRKALRLQTAAQLYLEKAESPNSDWRIDVVTVEMTRSGRIVNIEHIRNAIEDQR